ncbi:MAG: hypothetical protein U1E56_04935 [Bauldia sp.]
MFDFLWQFLARFEDTGISTWVREGYFISDPFATFYVMLGFHSIGMAAVVGISFMLSIRLFGFFRHFSVEEARKFLVIGWAGFIINLISGVLLLLAQPRRELITATFDIKILMVILACITMGMMQKAMGLTRTEVGPGGVAVEVIPDNARLLALLTNLFWLGAIVSGRVIGYLQPPPP